MQARHQRLVVGGNLDQLVELAGQGPVLLAQVVDLPFDQGHGVAGFMRQLQGLENFRVTDQEVGVFAQMLCDNLCRGPGFFGHFKFPSNT